MKSIQTLKEELVKCGWAIKNISIEVLISNGKKEKLCKSALTESILLNTKDPESMFFDYMTHNAIRHIKLAGVS